MAEPMLRVQLFGRFRDFSATAEVVLPRPAVDRVEVFRAEFDRWALAQWPDCTPDLLRASALATATTLLRGADPLPADGQLALLPPVSGG